MLTEERYRNERRNPEYHGARLVATTINAHESLIYLAKRIQQECDMLNSGNLAHHRASMRWNAEQIQGLLELEKKDFKQLLEEMNERANQS